MSDYNLEEDTPQFSAGKYTVDLNSNGCEVSKFDSRGNKIFICGGIDDPMTAMQIVEGLILVEFKRFNHPDSEPVFKNDNDIKVEEETEKQIPFLKGIGK